MMSGKSFMSRLGAGKKALSLIAEVRSAREEIECLKAELAAARKAARKAHANMRACDTTFAAVRVGIAALAKLEEK